MTESAEKGNWDDDFKSSKDNNSNGGNGTERRKAQFMMFKESGNYEVRFVGAYVRFLRHWMPFDKKDRIITHKDYKGKDPAWNAGFYPRKTFAIHVIDRKDQKLKILEKGSQIFEALYRFKTANNINPAGKDAPDFVITVEIPKNDPRATKYSVTAKAAMSPLTDKELEMIKTEFYPLGDIYRTTPLEKIKELWDKLPEDKKIPPKKDNDKQDKNASETKSASAKKEKPAPTESVADTSADDSDPFAEGAAEEGDSTELF